MGIWASCFVYCSSSRELIEGRWPLWVWCGPIWMEHSDGNNK